MSGWLSFGIGCTLGASITFVICYKVLSNKYSDSLLSIERELRIREKAWIDEHQKSYDESIKNVQKAAEMLKSEQANIERQKYDLEAEKEVWQKRKQDMLIEAEKATTSLISESIVKIKTALTIGKVFDTKLLKK